MIEDQPKIRNYVYGVDLVRFLSALAVALFHIGFSAWISPHSGGYRLVKGSYAFPELIPVAWFGWIGVEVFFVISGFVIAKSANGATPFAFLKSRVQRLYPAVWICAPITALALVASHATGNLARKLLDSLLLIPKNPWIDGQYWTLAVEAFFYLCVFLILVGGDFCRIRAFAYALALVSGLYLVLLTIDAQHVAHIPLVAKLAFGNYRTLMLRYGCFFALGILIYLRKGTPANLLDWAFAGISLVGCILEIQFNAHRLIANLKGTSAELKPGQWVVPAAVWIVAVAAILVANHRAEHPSRLKPKSLGYVRQMGLATYPIYLLHFAVGVTLMRLMVTHGVGRFPALAISFAGIVAASTLVVSLEAVVRRWIRRGLDRLEERMLKPKPAFAWLFRPAKPR